MVAGQQHHKQQTNAGDGLAESGSAGMTPPIGNTATDDAANYHAESGEHHQHWYEGR